MKRVLVIGKNSYIGQKFNTYVFDKFADSIQISFVSASDNTWEKIDFSSYDVVLHLSGIVHRKEKKEMETLYYNVNYKLAVEVAKKAKESNVKQFIFMSTAAVYDLNSSRITKDTKPNPKTFYGKSKLAAEEAIVKLQNDSFQVTIVRPPMVYGDGCKGNYPKLMFIAKYVPIFPEYHNKRSMIHIDNLCELLADLIKNEKIGYFHPQDDKFADTCEMVVAIRKEMGKRTFLIRKSDVLIKTLIPHSKIINKMFNDFYYSEN